MNPVIKNICEACIYTRKGDNVGCSHPNAIIYLKLDKPCTHCKREAGVEKGGCGVCTGNGKYIYPGSDCHCDCGGWVWNNRYNLEGIVFTSADKEGITKMITALKEILDADIQPEFITKKPEDEEVNCN